VGAVALAARAQQRGKIAKIGFLYPGPEAVAKARSALLLAGLASEGLREPGEIALLICASVDVAQIGPLLNELLANKVDLLIPAGPALISAVHAMTK
jgi:putative tryptophan/tyrosine transport system substrate-binding protein